MKFLLNIIENSVNCHLYNIQLYINIKQNLTLLIYSFNIYFTELKV